MLVWATLDSDAATGAGGAPSAGASGAGLSANCQDLNVNPWTPRTIMLSG